MSKYRWKEGSGMLLLAGTLLLLWTFSAQAAIQGLSGSNFSFTARAEYISTAEGNSVPVWGFADGGGTAQYPGPTLILTQNTPVTITLTNELTIAGQPGPPVSILFPGQAEVTATGGTPGLLTQEAQPAASATAAPGEKTVTYTFTPTEPGTYTYHSGTDMDLQVEMGLLGAIIVRPAGFDPANPQAYADASSAYDREVLMVLTEIDPTIHELVEFGRLAEIDTTAFWPVYWFINGRTAPDTMLPNYVSWLPSQPYNCMPRIHPGERLLIRWVGGGRDLHPFHTHGNNFDLIARDGRLLSSGPGAGADLAVSEFTQAVAPGATYDAIFSWTGEKLGWDMYGTLADGAMYDHACNGALLSDPICVSNPAACQPLLSDPVTQEYCGDHGKPFPVSLPGIGDLTPGSMYSGSPYLGGGGYLPPGDGGFNANGGFFYMWHSHNEKEMVNFDIFPGGLMTMLIIEPLSAAINE